MIDFVLAHWAEIAWPSVLVAIVPAAWWVGGKLFSDDHPNN
jgi:hypothetical protein